jgi:phosphinothricin acetyltransferase
MIRDAIADDLPAIVEIYNSTIPSRIVTADLEPVSVESRIPWFEAHSRDRYPLWVLEQDGEIAGWLGFQMFYGRPAYCETAEVSLYVAENYRHQGIGSQLLSHAIEQSPKLGITTLLGIVFAANLPSLRLLKRFGFEHWGYLPQVAKMSENAGDVVILGKKLGG